MSFFAPDGDGLAAHDARALGVPAVARTRLAQLGSGGLFSSTLSVAEFALLSELGPRPVAHVLGASVHQVGWQYLPPAAQWAGDDFHFQLNVVSGAWDQARRAAFERLLEEARSVGADAVVGVRLRRGEHDWARRSVDFVVSGTAIALPLSDRERPRAEAALSNLSVQEYWKLAAIGWEPAGLLAATSVYFVSQGSRTRWRRLRSTLGNQELHEFSDGFLAARRAVVAELRSQARSAGADGIVGVDLRYEMSQETITVQGAGRQATGLSSATFSIGGGDLVPLGGADRRSGIVFTVHAVGTAIRRGSAVDRVRPTPAMRLGVPG